MFVEGAFSAAAAAGTGAGSSSAAAAAAAAAARLVPSQSLLEKMWRCCAAMHGEGPELPDGEDQEDAGAGGDADTEGWGEGGESLLVPCLVVLHILAPAVVSQARLRPACIGLRCRCTQTGSCQSNQAKDECTAVMPPPATTITRLLLLTAALPLSAVAPAYPSRPGLLPPSHLHTHTCGPEEVAHWGGCSRRPGGRRWLAAASVPDPAAGGGPWGGCAGWWCSGACLRRRPPGCGARWSPCWTASNPQ